jgi:hypothetical protein
LDDEDGTNADNTDSRQQHSSSSTPLEQSRAIDNSSQGNGTDLRDMVRGIQRYLAANRSPSNSNAASTPQSAATTSAIRNREAQRHHRQQHRQSGAGSSRTGTITSTTTVQQRLATMSSFDDGKSRVESIFIHLFMFIFKDVDFVPLIADEPLMERDVLMMRTEDEGGSRMSIDNSGGGDLLILSEDDEEMNN